MKRLMALLAVAAFVGGCSDLKVDTPETVMREMTSLLSQSAEELGKVQDEGSAQEVRPKIQGAWSRWTALERRLDVARDNQRRPPSTQVMKTAETQLNLSKKLFITQWRRLNSPKRPWGEALSNDFMDFITAVTGEAKEPEREFVPATLDSAPGAPRGKSSRLLEEQSVPR